MPETASPSSVWRSSTRSYTTTCSLGTPRRGTPLADPPGTGPALRAPAPLPSGSPHPPSVGTRRLFPWFQRPPTGMVPGCGGAGRRVPTAGGCGRTDRDRAPAPPTFGGYPGDGEGQHALIRRLHPLLLQEVALRALRGDLVPFPRRLVEDKMLQSGQGVRLV